MNPVIDRVTKRIQKRSEGSRGEYLARVSAAASKGPSRTSLSCSNLAHGMAASGRAEKDALAGTTLPNIGIVSAYNDMLSAHQPFERYPAIIKQAAAAQGAVAQFAGGVPAMCDGVTQGQDGMDLSLFSRDVIAMSTAIALSHDMFDAALCLGICDKIVPGLLIGALSFGHLPVAFVPPDRCSRACPTKKKREFARNMRPARSAVMNCLLLSQRRTTGRAPAPSMAQPTATRCSWSLWVCNCLAGRSSIRALSYVNT